MKPTIIFLPQQATDNKQEQEEQQQSKANQLLKFLKYFLVIIVALSGWIQALVNLSRSNRTYVVESFKTLNQEQVHVAAVDHASNTSTISGDPPALLADNATSSSSSSSSKAFDCQSLVEERRMARKSVYERLFKKFPLDPKNGNLAERFGILKADGDLVQPIDCELYQQQQPYEDNRTVYFLHIHKAGGTSFCAAARANYYFANFNNNCNANPTKRCCGGNSIEAHRQFAQKTPYKFVANEWPMYDTMDHERYRYVVQMRQAKDRLNSDYNYDKLKKRKHIPFDQWLHNKPDNFSMRMICGDRCMLRPKFQLTRQDFHYTLQRLQKFDNIVLLEDYQRTYGIFASEIGWNTWPGAKNHNKKTNANTRTTPEYITTLDKRYVALDDAIYQFAVSLLNQNSTTKQQQQQQQQQQRSETSSSTTIPYYALSPDIDKAVEEYFESLASIQNGMKNNNCKNACCDKCTYMFAWGNYMGNLLTGKAT